MATNNPPTLAVTIPSTPKSVFKQYLHIINPMLPKKSKLTDKEILVLGTLMEVDHYYKSYPPEARNAIIFHAETKKRVREAISKESPISIEAFNNIMMQLRTKGFISKNSLIHKVPMDDTSIRINIELVLKAE